MIDKNKIASIVQTARKNGKVCKYSDFCKTKESKEYSLTKLEIEYYTSLEKRRSY